MGIIDLFKNISFYISNYGSPILQAIGFIGDIISLIIFSMKSRRKNASVLYLTCYTLASLCFLSVNLIGRIFYYLLGISFNNLHNITCKLYLYTFYLFATLAPNVLIFASIDRLLISSQKVDVRLYSSKRLAYFSLGISSGLWTIYYLHILIESSIQQNRCKFDQSSTYLSFVYYSLAVTNLIGCLCVTILVLMSLKNIRYFRDMSRQQRTQQIHTMKRKDFQLVRCMYALDIIYILFSTPSLIYDVLYTSILKNGKESIEQAVYSFLSTFLSFLTIIPYTSCFWIFCILSKAFRYEIKRVLYKIIGQYLTPLREDDNNVQVNMFVSQKH